MQYFWNFLFQISNTGMLKYGRGSIHATQQPLDDICRDLHCQRERYTWTSHPALEGTFCGNDKVTLYPTKQNTNWQAAVSFSI